MRAPLTWDHIKRFRDLWPRTLVLKGVMHPDDATRAANMGCDGIVVSNHGGRQLDGALSTVKALPPIADAVGIDVEIFADSGVRSGLDVVRMLALGAKGVLLGRAAAYALAAAGGVRQPVSKVALQLTRGAKFQSMPLEAVIRDPRQNIALKPGDVVTALFQPLSFTALGATGRQDEVPFEAQGISLAQALGRIGGLIDSRSDVRGIFIFRFEPRDNLDWPRQPVATTPDGNVPVVYQLDLSDPRSFFAMLLI